MDVTLPDVPGVAGCLACTYLSGRDGTQYMNLAIAKYHSLCTLGTCVPTNLTSNTNRTSVRTHLHKVH